MTFLNSWRCARDRAKCDCRFRVSGTPSDVDVLAEFRRRQRAWSNRRADSRPARCSPHPCPRSAGSSRPSGRRRRAARASSRRRRALRTRSAGPGCSTERCCASATGTPMRSTHCANNSLALAEPEPFTLANLTTKSLVDGDRAYGHRESGLCGFEIEFLHVPGACRAALGAEPAMQADVFILHHHAAGLERVGDVEVLRQVGRRRGQLRAQHRLRRHSA